MKMWIIPFCLATLLCAACGCGGTDAETEPDTSTPGESDSEDSDTSTPRLQSCEGVVVFEDGRLEERVRFWLGYEMALGKPYEGELTGEVLLNLRTRVTASFETVMPEEYLIHSLYGLECAVNLEILGLTGNAVSDLLPLSRLEKLQQLSLSSNRVKDLSPLLGLSNLHGLSVSYNPIEDLSVLRSIVESSSAWRFLGLEGLGLEDVSFLSALPDLVQLYISDNQVTDLLPLADALKLSHIFLNRNEVTTLAPLAGRDFATLHAANNRIEDISALSQATYLPDLDLSNNRIEDISALESAAGSIIYLRLHGNAISDISVIPDMTVLHLVTLYDNAISDISPLEGIAFQGLDLSYNRISELEPLRAMAGKFGQLALAHNDVVDFEPVLDVQELNLAWNKVSDLGALAGRVESRGTFNFAGNPISSLSPLLLAASGGFRPHWVVVSATPLDVVALDYEAPLLCEFGTTVFYGDDLSCPGETTENPYPVSGAQAPSASTEVLPGDPLCESGGAFLVGRGVPPDVRDEESYAVEAAEPTEPLVRDSLTGLAWRRCSAGQSWDGTSCTGTATSLSWEQAQEACQGEYGGASSWRLPELDELMTLVDRGLAHPNVTIEPTAFPGTYPGRYWSATAVQGSADRARFAVSFYNGTTITATALEPGDKGAKAAVRCVLDEEANAPLDRFELADDVVRDTWTSLEWTRCPLGASFDQQACGESEPFAALAEAKQACQSLGSGWRLPTTGELLSIVDPCRREPALAEPFVDTVKNTTDRGPSWTSTSYEATDSERAYAVDLSTGQVVLLKPQTLAAVRCTRLD